MGSKFYNAISNSTVGENGMPTHETSGSRLLDLFFAMGASRKTAEDNLKFQFSLAYQEDKLLALKAMFYNRDIRGGQGERRSFRTFMKWLYENDFPALLRNLHLVPEYGRYDDLLSLVNPTEKITSKEVMILHFLVRRLLEKDKLCAKWMPREKSAEHNLALKIIKFMGISAKNYRKLLANNTEVIETLMCQKRWDLINYSHVPSVASNKYRKAFYRNDATRYGQWVEDVKSGKKGVKVNAGAIFPSDIVHKILELVGMSTSYAYSFSTRGTKKAGVSKTEIDSLEIQWKALPNFVPEGKSFIPVCDTSGSMSGQPLEVCIALGIYLAERNSGPFKDLFFTFSSTPKLEMLQGSNLVEKVDNLSKAAWQGSTNLEAMFKLLLEKAKSASLSEADMPKYLLIMSDMQFNQCTTNKSSTALDMIKKMYKASGYEMPGIVFWNLHDSIGVPALDNATGAALVSGYSPSVMKTLLSGELTPYATMLRTLNQERYSQVQI